MLRKENYTIAGARGRLMAADLTYDDTCQQGPLILFVHGFKGFKDWGTHNLVARYFAENGFRFLKFNFSHNGTTPDQPADFADLIAFSENTFSIELDDLSKLIDFACNGGVIPKAAGVCLVGHSLGGAISIIKASTDTRVRQLVTLASISSFRQLWPAGDEAQWRLQGLKYFLNARTGQQMPIKSAFLDDLDQHPFLFDVEARAAEVKQPWLILHGAEDTSVLLDCAVRLKEVQPAAELLTVKGADHVFNATHPYPADVLPAPLQEVCQVVLRFLKTKT